MVRTELKVKAPEGTEIRESETLTQWDIPNLVYTAETDDRGLLVHIHAIWVPSRLRGQGIGTAMLKALEEAVAQAGGGVIWGEAFPYTEGRGATYREVRELIRWWKKRGYKLQEDLNLLKDAYREQAEKWDMDPVEIRLGYDEVAHLTWFEKEIPETD